MKRILPNISLSFQILLHPPKYFFSSPIYSHPPACFLLPLDVFSSSQILSSASIHSVLISNMLSSFQWLYPPPLHCILLLTSFSSVWIFRHPPTYSFLLQKCVPPFLFLSSSQIFSPHPCAPPQFWSHGGNSDFCGKPLLSIQTPKSWFCRQACCWCSK